MSSKLLRTTSGGVMDRSKTELMYGTLDMLVLQVLDEGPLHGYAISKRLRHLSDEVLEIEQGSLYPALYRMERKAWLRSRWGKSDSGRRARVYRLTATGRRQLAAQATGWQRFASAVSRVMGAAEETR